MTGKSVREIGETSGINPIVKELSEFTTAAAWLLEP